MNIIHNSIRKFSYYSRNVKVGIRRQDTFYKLFCSKMFSKILGNMVCTTESCAGSDICAMLLLYWARHERHPIKYY